MPTIINNQSTMSLSLLYPQYANYYLQSAYNVLIFTVPLVCQLLLTISLQCPYLYCTPSMPTIINNQPTMSLSLLYPQYANYYLQSAYNVLIFTVPPVCHLLLTISLQCPYLYCTPSMPTIINNQPTMSLSLLYP